MSISNRSVDVKATTEVLTAQLAEYEASLAERYELDTEDAEYAEWLESGIELIEDELARREDDEPHADSPSLQDSGIELGSYAS